MPPWLPPAGQVAHAVQEVLQGLQGAWREEEGRGPDGILAQPGVLELSFLTVIRLHEILWSM